MKAVPLLWLLLLVVVFYFLILRPARVRQRQASAVQGALDPGLEVMTTAGLFATVSSVEDDVVVLEIAPGVRSRYAKAAIARIITPDAGPVETSAGSGQDETGTGTSTEAKDE